jgi:hypothetical protein
MLSCRLIECTIELVLVTHVLYDPLILYVVPNFSVYGLCICV